MFAPPSVRRIFLSPTTTSACLKKLYMCTIIIISELRKNKKKTQNTLIISSKYAPNASRHSFCLSACYILCSKRVSPCVLHVNIMYMFQTRQSRRGRMVVGFTTDRHDITKMWLKETLNTITINESGNVYSMS